VADDYGAMTAIVDPDALIARLRRGDIVAGLEVGDPGPIPADSPLKVLPDVFLSPLCWPFTPSRALF
jgi:phosphoglycerate dehydrogenase-like enzyme